MDRAPRFSAFKNAGRFFADYKGADRLFDG